MDTVVGDQVGLVAFWLVPGNGDANVFRHVAARPPPQLVDDRDQGVPGIQHIIDDQQAIVVA